MRLADIDLTGASSPLMVRITLESELCINLSGTRHADAVSQVKQFAISGSHLKGLARNAAIIISGCTGDKICSEPGENCAGETPCVVCEIFGNECLPGAVNFTDCAMAHGAGSAGITRAVARVDSRTRKSRHVRLLQTVAAGSVMTGRVEFKRPLSNAGRLLLLRSLAYVNKLGALRTAGCGLVKVEVMES